MGGRERGERGRDVREREEGDREGEKAGNIEENTISRAQPTTLFASQKVALQISELSSLPSGQSGMPSHKLELPLMQPTPEGQVIWLRKGGYGTGTESKAGTLSDPSQPLGLLLGGWIIMQHNNPDCSMGVEGSIHAYMGFLRSCSLCQIHCMPCTPEL